MPKLYQSIFLAQPKDLNKEIGKSLQVAFPELTDGVMVGVTIGCNHPEGYVFMRSFLDFTRTGNAYAVGVQEKAHHHPRIIRRLPSLIAVGVVYG